LVARSRIAARTIGAETMADAMDLERIGQST
jgi:hypothetical protein